jgi:hypothetical protein
MCNTLTDEDTIHRRTGELLTRFGLLSHAGDLPAPFKTLTGETEQSTTAYYYLLRRDGKEARLISVKRIGDDETFRQLWHQINELRKEPASRPFLPVPNNTPSDGLLIYDDGLWIAKALRRMKILQRGQRLPRPRAVLSGIAGLSRVYLLHLEGADGHGQVVLVKFDRPDRVKAEWKQIQVVRTQADAPRELVTPLPANVEKDGVIVFGAFQGQSLSGKVLQLDQFLRDQILSNFVHVSHALSFLDAFLKQLYLGGREHYDAKRWKDYNQDLVSHLPAIKELVSRELIRDLHAAHWQVRLRSRSVKFPNPFARLTERLDEPTGRLLKARTHGDLQSTNLLLAMGAFGRPESLAVIDLEKYG